MDIPPVPNQPTSFIFPQRSFGKANPVKRSFQASWFSARTWLHHNETYKISSASRAKIVPKCIKIVCTDVRKYKIFSGVIPRTPLTRGEVPPLVLSPKCIKIVCTDVRKYKIFSGEIPRTPLTRGEVPPLVLSPTRAFGTRKTSLIFHGRTTFQKTTTALQATDRSYRSS